MTQVHITAPPLTPARVSVRRVELSRPLRLIHRLRIAPWLIEWAVQRELRAEALRAYDFDKPDEERIAEARARFAEISKHSD